MTVTVRAPLPSGLPPKKWGSPDIFANVAVLAIAVSTPVFPHQNLEGPPPARVRQLAEFIAPNLAVRTGAIPPARNVYDSLPGKRWPEQFLFPSMAVLPTAVPLRPALFDLLQRRGPYADYVPPNLAVLSAIVLAPPPAGFRDFGGPVPKRWPESVVFGSSRMPTAAPIVPLVFDAWQKTRFALDSLSPNLAVLIPAVSPAPPPQFDSAAPQRRKLADWVAGSTAYISAAPIICATFDSAPRRKWIDSNAAPNVAIYATIALLAPQPSIDYQGLPRKRWSESQPMGSTFMPTAPPIRPFQFETSLPIRRWQADEQLNYLVLPPPASLRRDEFTAGRDRIRYTVGRDNVEFSVPREQVKFKPT